MATDDNETETPARPALRIVRGDPTPEEIAALTVVLAAVSGGGSVPDPGPPSRWADPGARVRRPLRPGPGSWVASARGL